MIVTSVLKNILWALRYPSFVNQSNLVGDYHVGVIQTRIPLVPSRSSTRTDSPSDATTRPCPSCQIHYPTDPSCKSSASSSFHPYFRPQAVEGMADYSRQSPSLLAFLSQRAHPCLVNATPLNLGTANHKFPIVIFSHGLGGCMEMYTELCMHIASKGYCVIAIEHGDGSGAYAENPLDGTPIFYQRPDDTPYSRTKVVNFRRPFLQHRVQEIQSVLDYIFDKDDNKAAANKKSTRQATHTDKNSNYSNNDLLAQVLEAADTSSSQRKVHLVGHSFGGATMVLASQDATLNERYQMESLSTLDCWAFSLDDQSLNRGISPTTPILSLLSEAWVTNPETKQIQQLLRASSGDGDGGHKGVVKGSHYVPNSVHASFSDSVNWLPGIVSKRMRLRAPREVKHETIRTAAIACVNHMQQTQRDEQSEEAPAAKSESISKLVDQGKLVAFPFRESSSRVAVSVSASA